MVKKISFSIGAASLAAAMMLSLAGCSPKPPETPPSASGSTAERQTPAPAAAAPKSADTRKYYPDIFSDVPELDFGLDWEVEVLAEYSPIEIADEEDNIRRGINMQIKYGDKGNGYDIDEITGKYLTQLLLAGFGFYDGGELWGEERNCYFYVYIKGDVYVDVEIYNGTHDFNGIIVRLDAGDAAKYQYKSYTEAPDETEYADEPEYAEYMPSGTGYYPGVFSVVPELDLDMDWDAEIQADYSPIEIAGADNKRYHGLNMHIKYGDRGGGYDTGEAAEKYIEQLSAEGFEFYESGELWGEAQNCNYYVYVKDSVYAAVEVFNGTHDFNGIIIRLYSGEAAAYRYRRS